MFEAMFDEETGLIICRTAGFHGVDAIAEHQKIMRGLIKHANQTRGQAHILVLASEMPVLAREASEAAARRTDDTLDDGSAHNRMAVVVGSALMRRQANRIFNGRHARFFASEREARDWLAASS